tara:strand:+ start:864 stop:1043 length:180 start_codon:yes stop_codon:yes gene_type:complete
MLVFIMIETTPNVSSGCLNPNQSVQMKSENLTFPQRELNTPLVRRLHAQNDYFVAPFST